MDAQAITQIIKDFGGQTATAHALGLHVSTVDSWRRRGSIPYWRMDVLRKAARRYKVDLSALEET